MEEIIEWEEEVEDIDRCSHLNLNIMFLGGRKLKSHSNVKSAHDCRWLCLEKKECRVWSYANANYVSEL